MIVIPSRSKFPDRRIVDAVHFTLDFERDTSFGFILTKSFSRCVEAPASACRCAAGGAGETADPGKMIFD